MKKMLAALLCGAMVVSMLAGCAAAPESSEPAAVESDSEDVDIEEPADEVEDVAEAPASDDPAAAVIAERKAAAESSGEYQKVVVAFMDWTGAPAGLDRINEAISEHTRETLGLDVELMIIDSAAYGEDMKLMLSSGEQVDVFSSLVVGYIPCINNEYVLDLEEDNLLADYGKGLYDVVRPDYFDACRFGGTLYGVPPIKDYAIQTACVIMGTEYLDGIGYDYEGAPKDEQGYIKCGWDEIDNILAQLHEKYPDKTVFALQDNGLTQGSSVDALAGDYYGTLLDPGNSLKVEDVYSSDIFYEWADRAYRWNQAGYISGDALTDKTGASAKVKSGAYMCMMACGKPGYKNQISGECGRDVTLFDVGEPFMSSSAVSAFPWCINQATEDPVAAMQVLEALYTDPIVANLVCWGQEGVEYVVNDDTTIKFADGVDPNNSEYYPNVLWSMPNQYAAHVWEGDPVDLGAQTAAFNDNCVNKSKALGFTWDNGEYAAEYTALQNAYEEYAPQVVFGFVEPKKGIEDLVNALKAAGLDDYMQAKQEALDAWAAENGIQ